jgi:hypothetical protein
MRTIDTYIGIEPFTVLVDDSAKLRKLAERARELKGLPFQEKLDAVKRLALDSMINAYEQMIVWGRKADGLEGVTDIDSDGKVDNSEYRIAQEQQAIFRNIVFQDHPLSYALEQKAGCCRYQGALFFVLGYEAELGDQHFVQAAPVNRGVNTVFNEVVQDGKRQKVSIFTDSLENKTLDYSRQNPRILEQAFERMPGYDFFSYHRTQSGLVMIANPSQHAKTVGNIIPSPAPKL